MTDQVPSENASRRPSVTTQLAAMTAERDRALAEETRLGARLEEERKANAELFEMTEHLTKVSAERFMDAATLRTALTQLVTQWRASDQIHRWCADALDQLLKDRVMEPDQ